MSVPVPQPPALPIIGNVLNINPQNGIQSLGTLAETYGEIFKLVLFGKQRYVVSSVELLNELCDEKRFCKVVSGPLEQVRNGTGDGLFTAHRGEHNWDIAHRVLVPAFGPIGITHMFDEMYDIATQLVAKWARMGPDEPIKVTDDFTKLTLDTIALCTMDKRFNSFYHEDMHPFVGAMVRFLIESGQRTRRTRLEMLWNTAPQRQYEQDIALMRSVAKEVIDQRRANPVEKKDLLNAMLFGKDPKTGERLSDESIMNNLITFLIAGKSISFTSELIAH
jgi:cytochrome P450 / NADPH-cytochrome P450 reductase